MACHFGSSLPLFFSEKISNPLHSFFEHVPLGSKHRFLRPCEVGFGDGGGCIGGAGGVGAPTNSGGRGPFGPSGPGGGPHPTLGPWTSEPRWRSFRTASRSRSSLSRQRPLCLRAPCARGGSGHAMADAPAMGASTPKPEGTSQTVERESPPHTDFSWARHLQERAVREVPQHPHVGGHREVLEAYKNSNANRRRPGCRNTSADRNQPLGETRGGPSKQPTPHRSPCLT